MATVLDTGVTHMYSSCQYRSRRSRRPKSRSASPKFSVGLANDLDHSLGLIAHYAEYAERQLDQADFDRQELRDTLLLIHHEALGSGAILARLLSLARLDFPLT
jgi:hypothetical protein